MIIIDASAAVEILIRTPISIKIAKNIIDEDIHVPHLIDVEVTNALRRLTQVGGLELGVAEMALDGLCDWPLIRHEHTELLSRAWELRNSVSVYDACYVALAETLNAPLLTFDGKLSRSHGHHAKIELLH